MGVSLLTVTTGAIVMPLLVAVVSTIDTKSPQVRSMRARCSLGLLSASASRLDFSAVRRCRAASSRLLKRRISLVVMLLRSLPSSSSTATAETPFSMIMRKASRAVCLSASTVRTLQSPKPPELAGVLLNSSGSSSPELSVALMVSLSTKVTRDCERILTTRLVSWSMTGTRRVEVASKKMTCDTGASLVIGFQAESRWERMPLLASLSSKMLPTKRSVQSGQALPEDASLSAVLVCSMESGIAVMRRSTL
mmetsp:Transcript_17062/g.43266  ORF Transcript_17062/g.43266 Transcript_17062/m.43266 type:complete len:251 (-) Transcript_17062:275-1027(-)